MPPNMHGTALRYQGHGVLVRGPSGAGKSRLALALLQAAGVPVGSEGPCPEDAATGLIADDRVTLIRDGVKLMAEAVQPLAGLLEVRGIGIVKVPYLRTARLDLVVSLVGGKTVERLPENTSTTLQGATLRHVQVPIGDLAHQVLMVRTMVSLLDHQR